MPPISAQERRRHLETLKACRAGQKREYKVSQDDIYETVSEETYKSIVQGRLAEDDFIENDDDSGYVDQGTEEWEESLPDRPRKSKTERTSRKANARQTSNSSSSTRPSSTIARNTRLGPNAQGKAMAKESASLNAYRKVKDPVASEDFMKNLMDGLGPQSLNPSGSGPSATASRHQPSSRVHSSETPSDHRKRKGTQTAFETSAGLLSSSPPKRNEIPSSSPSLGDIEDYERNETYDDCSSAGIGGFLSSEGAADVERQTKKPRINSLHHDLVDLKVEDFQMDDLLDDIKPEKPLENNEISHDIGTNISCQDASRDEKSGQDTRDKPDVPVVTPNETDIKTLAKSKAVGLDWQKVLRDLPTVSNVDSSTEANLKLLIDDSEDKPESSDAPDGNETFQKPDVGETTDFLANLPRKKKPLKTPRISKKALAQAEADRHLPKPTPVDAFVSQTDADLKIASSDDAPQGNQLKFFWLDCHEVEGALYLFGKVFDQLSSKYVACCVIVEGLERNLFVLPRPTIVDEDGIEVRPTEDDVYDEIEEVLQSHSITEFKAKVVRRKYCFEERGVPSDSDWHKVVYSYSKPAIPRNTTGRTFSKIFGTTTSAFELFLLKRKIMGPCWLDIQQAFPYEGSTPVSWCKLEVKVKNPKMINPCSDADPMAKEIPPLDILSLSVRDVMNHKDNKKEIVCVTARIWQEANLDDTIPIDQQSSVVKTFLRPLASFPAGTHEACRRSMPPIIPLKEEHMLLSVLLGTINSYDPDIIIGYDLTNVALDVILHRMRDLKTPHWSRIGRLRRDKLPSLRASGSNNHLLTGRLLCDLSSDGFKSMVVSTTWSLTELCQNYLQISREDLDPDETVDFFDSTCAKPNRLINFVKHCEADSYFQMALIHKVQYLGLTKQLTNLAGNNWNSTLYGGRAQRNEFILLHEFHRHKFICPDKLSFNDRKALAKSGGLGDGPTEPGKEKGKAVKKDKYKGGLVFEPKRGLWDKFILVMDFNSLYPSIIQEYNIDFTTIDRSSCNDDEDDRMPDLPSPDIKQGVLPKLIAGLVGRRREVKKLMKAPGVSASKAAQYDIKQLALKLTANSMYGCLGFEGSRFYARPLAALTTSKGREILTNTRELAENQNLDVIYGDTDSVMINTNALDFTTANKIGSDFKKLVNERYKLLEIDIDGVFERMLLLQKKKYAALKVNESSQARTVEIKGLDMKRREFCKLSKDTSQFILEQVLSGLPTELVVEKIHEYLSELGKEVKEGRKNLEDFIIHKKLGKNPQDYPDAKSQPHVQVALRMNLKGNVKTKAGDVIPYIFCLGEDGSSSSRSAQADKARHPDDLRRVDTPWKIDYDYYLALQVLPAIERLCEPIEGTDRSRLAECLGLDPARFKNTTASVPDTQTEFHTLESQIPESERFADASPFTVRCRHCSEQFEFRGAQADQAGMITPSGLNCPNLECRKPLGVPSLVVQMELQIRQFIGKFYEAWLICDDAACKNRTRMMSVYGRKCLNSSMGCKGQMSYEYTDKMLYNQLLYFHGLFDPSKAEAKFRGTAQADKIAQTLEANEQALAILRGVVNRYLQKNGRRFVGMDSLFSFMKIKGL